MSTPSAPELLHALRRAAAAGDAKAAAFLPAFARWVALEQRYDSVVASLLARIAHKTR